MIAYDLQCAAGHTFEGWFENATGFDEQKERGLLTCPICGSAEVNRVMSTFGIARRRHRESSEKTPVNPLEIITRYVDENFEDVGVDFAKEALKIYYGVAEQRNIRGVSSEQEEKILREEGVPFFKVPVKTSPGSKEEE